MPILDRASHRTTFPIFTMNMPIFHSALPIVRRAAPLLIVVCTGVIFVVDLNFPMGFAPWLPYFVLAFAMARLYEPRTLVLATVFWSLAIMGEPLLHSEIGDHFAEGPFNRTLGVITLWILIGLLYADIVARREKQASESRLHAILEGALDAVVITDRRGLVVEWNPQAEIIFGFSRQEAVGKQLAELIIPSQYREAHAKGMQRFLSTGQEKILRRRIEITALRNSGVEFPVELTVIPLHLGDQVLFSSFIRDISERKESESALRQTTTFIESLFEHVPNMIFVKDAKDLRFVRFNKAGEELLGYSRSELLGKNDYDFFPAQEADFFTTKDRETISNGRLTDIPEEPIRTKNKGIRLLHTKKIPIYDAVGTAQYLLGISEDVTERKEAEAALVKARLAAEQASKAKSDFLANMSHEMRTPLNAIIGISDYLLRTRLSSEQSELVSRCIKASDGLLRIIEDLLHAAKSESGTLQLVAEPFILGEIVTEATDLMTTTARDKGLPLTLELAPRLPIHVQGDAHRLQQVLLNLIRNAIKFTETGHITVRVSPFADARGTDLIRFAVTDTGVGIDPDQCEMIFNRFTQADSTSNRQYGGVGLGLSICKQLVELMGGRIWVDSVRGQGSTFSFTVPLPSLKQALTPTISAHTRQNAVPPVDQHRAAFPKHGLNILLAEDSIESQEVMRLYLRNSPHRLDCASTGTRAVRQFKEATYDLVFMDLQMPEMDGYTATSLIRTWEAEQKLPRTPIVVLTANGLQEAKQKSLEAGCDEFLTKPIKMEAVQATIQRYFPSSTEPVSQNRSPDAPLGLQRLDAALQQMTPTFLQNRHRDVTALQAAITEKNFNHIKTIGHSIKGLAGSYGLHGIGTIGSAIERAASAQDIEQITIQVRALLQAVREAEQTCQAGSVTTPTQSDSA